MLDLIGLIWVWFSVDFLGWYGLLAHIDLSLCDFLGCLGLVLLHQCYVGYEIELENWSCDGGMGN